MAENESSSINQSPSGYLVPPAPPSPPAMAPTLPPLSQESALAALENLEFVSSLERLPFVPENIDPKAMFLRAGADAIPSMAANLGQMSQFSSTHTVADYGSRMVMGLVIQPLTEIVMNETATRNAKKKHSEIAELLHSRDGLVLEGEDLYAAVGRQHRDVIRALDEGAFDFSPEVKMRAIREVAKSYLSGSMPFLESLDVAYGAHLGGAVGTQFIGTSQDRFSHYRFAEADRLLKHTFKVCGPDARLTSEMSALQQDTLSWVRSAIESRIMAKHERMDVKAYIKEEYLPFLEELDPAAAVDFQTRTQAVIRARKLFNSNVPESKMLQKLQKLKEVLKRPQLGVVPTAKQGPTPPTLNPPTIGR